MRKALVVGIDYYQHGKPLYGCVDDAHAVKPLLDATATARSTSESNS